MKLEDSFGAVGALGEYIALGDDGFQELQVVSMASESGFVADIW